MTMLVNVASFLILALLWLSFGAAILIRSDLPERSWKGFRRLPIAAQIALAFLGFPVVLGLWIWNTRWPFWLRLALVAGLAWMTIFSFFPQPPLA